MRALDRILGNTPLGREIVAFIVWGHDGRVLYSGDPSQIGRRYPVDEDLGGAFNGEVTWGEHRALRGTYPTAEPL